MVAIPTEQAAWLHLVMAVVRIDFSRHSLELDSANSTGVSLQCDQLFPKIQRESALLKACCLLLCAAAFRGHPLTPTFSSLRTLFWRVASSVLFGPGFRRALASLPLCLDLWAHGIGTHVLVPCLPLWRLWACWFGHLKTVKFRLRWTAVDQRGGSGHHGSGSRTFPGLLPAS